MKVNGKQPRKCFGFIDLHNVDRTVIKSMFSLLESCKTGMPRVMIHHAGAVLLAGASCGIYVNVMRFISEEPPTNITLLC